MYIQNRNITADIGDKLAVTEGERESGWRGIN